MGDSPPETERDWDDERAVLGRAGEPGVLGRRPGVMVTVLCAIDPRFWLDAKGETKVMPPDGAEAPPAALAPDDDAGLAPLIEYELGDAESADPGVAARTSEVRRRLAGTGRADGLMAVVAGRRGAPPAGANGLVKKGVMVHAAWCARRRTRGSVGRGSAKNTARRLGEANKRSTRGRDKASETKRGGGAAGESGSQAQRQSASDERCPGVRSDGVRQRAAQTSSGADPERAQAGDAGAARPTAPATLACPLRVHPRVAD